MTNRFMLVFAVIMAMVAFSSCDPLMDQRAPDGGLLTSDDATIAAVWVRVTDALDSRDRTAIKVLFSQQVLSQTDNINAQIDALLHFFQGKITSQKDDGGAGTSEDINGPEQTKEFFDYRFVRTNKDRYLLLVYYEAVDATHPENVGLFTLRVFRGKDDDTLWEKRDDKKIPGVSCKAV